MRTPTLSDDPIRNLTRDLQTSAAPQPTRLRYNSNHSTQLLEIRNCRLHERGAAYHGY
jgi:hypothetical protein